MKLPWEGKGSCESCLSCALWLQLSYLRSCLCFPLLPIRDLGITQVLHYAEGTQGMQFMLASCYYRGVCSQGGLFASVYPRELKG